MARGSFLRIISIWTGPSEYSGPSRCRHYSSLFFWGLPPEGLPLIHNHVWFAWKGFNSHWITSLIHVQSNVISLVAPTWCHGPWTPLRETWNERTSEFTLFNLVSRLSMGKQSAFSCMSHSQWLLVELLAAVRGFNFLAWCIWDFEAESRRSLPFQRCSTNRLQPLHHMKGRQACPLPACMVFLVSGEVKTVVHQIREELQSRFMVSGVDQPRSLSGSNAWSLNFGIESLWWIYPIYPYF